MEDSPQIIGPSDVVAALLHDAPSLLDRSRSMIEPVQRERDAIREHFAAQKRLAPLSDENGGFQVGCTDGGYTTSPFIIGDHVATMAVAVAQRDEGQAVGVVGHRQWSDFRGHSPDTETLAKAVMMAHEIELLASLPEDGVKIIDGSFLTHLTAIYTGLASSEEVVREETMKAASSPGFIEGLREAVSNPLVVACPKSDSSTALWAEASQALGLSPTGVPDKALATLLLRSGEVLRAGPDAFSWERLLLARAHVTDPRAKTVSENLTSITAPLVGKGTVNPIFVKPHGSNLCTRIEAKDSLTSFDLDDVIVSIGETVTAPFMQEPLAQYVADIFAKQVSTGTSVQVENLRLDLEALEGSQDFIDYFIRYYRTN